MDSLLLPGAAQTKGGDSLLQETDAPTVALLGFWSRRD